MVPNSRTGEGFIEASLSCLAESGSFVEVAKRNIWTQPGRSLGTLRPPMLSDLLTEQAPAGESALSQRFEDAPADEREALL